VARTVSGVASADHHLGEVGPVGGHRAVGHQAPEAVGVEHGACDVLAEDGECGHVPGGGPAGLVHFRRMQGADANAMPINEQRVAIDRSGVTLGD
jgi:hypothetical protein